MHVPVHDFSMFLSHPTHPFLPPKAAPSIEININGTERGESHGVRSNVTCGVGRAVARAALAAVDARVDFFEPWKEHSQAGLGPTSSVLYLSFPDEVDGHPKETYK